MTLRGGATAPSRAIVLAATALLVFVALQASDGRPQSTLRVAATDGVVKSSHDGLAVLDVAGMKPGETQSGTMLLSNGAAGPQLLTLSSAALSDVAGTGGGLLSRRLELTVERISPDAAVLFAGALGDLGSIDAGELNGKSIGSYRFTVRLPEGGPAIDDAFKDARASVTWRWQADSGQDPSTPAAPQTPDPAPVRPADDGWGAGDPRAVDGGPVRLWVGGGRRQRIDISRRRPGFVLLARCEPACAVQARITYRLRGRVRSLGTRSIGRAAWGQTPKRLVFHLKRGEVRLLRRALRKGIHATLTLTATAPGAGPAVTTRRIKLWR